MQQTPNYGFNKYEVNDVSDLTKLSPNFDIIDSKLKEVENKVNNAPPDSVNDDAIGTRTPDPSQAPAAPGTGKIGQLLSWITNRIKTITGKANWWDSPTKNLEQINTELVAHLADKANPHLVTAAQTGAVNKSGDTMTGSLSIDATDTEKSVIFNLGGVQGLRYFAARPNDGRFGAYDGKNNRIIWEYDPVTNTLSISTDNCMIANNKVYHAGNSGPFYKGSGSPEGVVAAPVGAIYQRTDGGAGTTFYVKQSGTGNTGWVAK